MAETMDSNDVGKDESAQVHDNEDDEDDDEISLGSTCQTHGMYQDEEVEHEWNGCVCGVVHKRPVPVYWVQCDGPCDDWYNVSPACVHEMTLEQAERVAWQCPKCLALERTASPILQRLLNLPADVWWRILEYTAPRTYRAAVLEQQIALLHPSALSFCRGDRGQGVWELLLQRDYECKANLCHSALTTTIAASPASISNAAPGTADISSRSRASKRRRKQTNHYKPAEGRNSIKYGSSNNTTNHPRWHVRKEHLAMLQRTEDVYHQVHRLSFLPQLDDDDSQKPTSAARPRLTLNGLRHILQTNQPINVNRPWAAAGRTLLHVCCAADVGEGTIVACVQYLMRHFGADPCVETQREHPYANRSALFFGISRVMPHLVQVMVEHSQRKDCTTLPLLTRVEGQFRLTFDTTRTITGCYSPLEFAQAIQCAEVLSVPSSGDNHNKPPPYWTARLKKIIEYLERKTQEQQEQATLLHQNAMAKKRTRVKARRTRAVAKTQHGAKASRDKQNTKQRMKKRPPPPARYPRRTSPRLQKQCG